MTHTSTEQPEALLIAKWLRESPSEAVSWADVAARLLEEMHARIAELEAENAHLKDAAWTAIDALEASHAQRVPLTDDQISDLNMQAWKGGGNVTAKLARLVEHAHGITQEKQG